MLAEVNGITYSLSVFRVVDGPVFSFVPEPATGLLAAAGLVALAAPGARRRKKPQ